MARVWAQRRNRFIGTVAAAIVGSVALSGGISSSHPASMPSLRFTGGEPFSGDPDGHVLLHVSSARHHVRVRLGSKPTVERAPEPHAGVHVGSAPARVGMDSAGIGIYHGGPRNPVVRENRDRTAAQSDETKHEVARQIADRHANSAEVHPAPAETDSQASSGDGQPTPADADAS